MIRKVAPDEMMEALLEEVRKIAGRAGGEK